MIFLLVATTLLQFSLTQTYNFTYELKRIPLQEFPAIAVVNSDGVSFDSKFPEEKSADLPADNGGNYGDLIYRFRENRDNLLLREVVISDELSSYEQTIRWTVSISAATVSSVRVLNFGRSRAYCLRIDVAAGDVQVFLRIPPLGDPRVMIEVYGF